VQKLLSSSSIQTGQGQRTGEDGEHDGRRDRGSGDLGFLLSCAGGRGDRGDFGVLLTLEGETAGWPAADLKGGRRRLQAAVVLRCTSGDGEWRNELVSVRRCSWWRLFALWVLLAIESATAGGELAAARLPARRKAGRRQRLLRAGGGRAQPGRRAGDVAFYRGADPKKSLVRSPRAMAAAPWRLRPMAEGRAQMGPYGPTVGRRVRVGRAAVWAKLGCGLQSSSGPAEKTRGRRRTSKTWVATVCGSKKERRKEIYFYFQKAFSWKTR
jgi:hypothetical protein